MGEPLLEYFPRQFPTDGKIIAPFWGDVDTSNGSGTVTFGVTTDATQLQKVREQVMTAFPERGSFIPAYVFVATWDSVGYFFMHSDLVSS